MEGTVSIGCGDLHSVQLLPELFRTFHQKYPAVTFDLYTATADHVREQMERGLIDDIVPYSYLQNNSGSRVTILLF